MKRLLIAFLLFSGVAVRAGANDYTDIWYNQAQPGYGFNFVQSNTFIFATFFVYGFGGQPTWLVAGLNWDGAGAYTGNLYAATGTYYRAPWDPANYVPTQVGTATFTPNPSNNWQGTLNYVVQSGLAASAAASPNKLATAVTVSIERQTLTKIPTGAIYLGGEAGSLSNCDDPLLNGPYDDKYELAVTEYDDGSVVYEFDYVSGLSCTITGIYEPHGQYYEVRNGSYVCNDGVNTIANMHNVKATDLGLEGLVEAINIFGNCNVNARFGGVLAN